MEDYKNVKKSCSCQVQKMRNSTSGQLKMLVLFFGEFYGWLTTYYLIRYLDSLTL